MAAQELGATAWSIGLVFATHSLFNLVASPFVGSALSAGLFSRPLAMLSGCLLCGGSAFLYGIIMDIYPAPAKLSFLLLTAATRAAQGFASALVDTAALASVSDLFHGGPHHSMAIGIAESCLSLGWVAGPPLGSILYALSTYSTPFIAVGGVMVAVAPTLLFVSPAPKGDGDHHQNNNSDNNNGRSVSNGNDPSTVPLLSTTESMGGLSSESGSRHSVFVTRPAKVLLAKDLERGRARDGSSRRMSAAAAEAEFEGSRSSAGKTRESGSQRSDRTSGWASSRRPSVEEWLVDTVSESASEASLDRYEDGDDLTLPTGGVGGGKGRPSSPPFPTASTTATTTASRSTHHPITTTTNNNINNNSSSTRTAVPPPSTTTSSSPSSSPLWLAVKQPRVLYVLTTACISAAAATYFDPTLGPHLDNHRHASPSFIGLVYMSWSLTYCVCTPLAGIVADGWGAHGLSLMWGLLTSSFVFFLAGPTTLLADVLPEAWYVGLRDSATALLVVCGALGISMAFMYVPIMPLLLYQGQGDGQGQGEAEAEMTHGGDLEAEGDREVRGQGEDGVGTGGDHDVLAGLLTSFYCMGSMVGAVGGGVVVEALGWVGGMTSMATMLGVSGLVTAVLLGRGWIRTPPKRREEEDAEERGTNTGGGGSNPAPKATLLRSGSVTPRTPPSQQEGRRRAGW